MSATTYEHDIESFDLEPIETPTHSDLADEIELAKQCGSPWELYRVRLVGGTGYARSGNTMEAVYFPHTARGGVAWGGGAEWTDAADARETVHLYLTGEMVP